MLTSFFSCRFNVYAKEDVGEIDLCRVLTRSNLRSEPSSNGGWIATVPEEALVIRIEGPIGDYDLIVYGEYKGYIYHGCLSHMDNKTYEDYCKQFPDLDIEAINKKHGIKSKEEVAKAEIPKLEMKVKPEREKLTDSSSDSSLDAEQDIKENQDEADSGDDSENTPEDSSEKQDSVENNSADDSENKSQDSSVILDNLDDIEEMESMTDENATVVKDSIDEANGEAKLILDIIPEKNRDLADLVPNSNISVEKENYEDIHETEYIESLSRGEKIISGPDKKGEDSDGNVSENSIWGNSASLILVKGGKGAEDSEQLRKDKVDVLITTNLRQLPTQDSEKLISVPAGSEVKVLDSGENGYVHVEYQGQAGYAFIRCLDYKSKDSYIGQTIDTKTEQSWKNDNLNMALSARRNFSKYAVSSMAKDSDDGNDSDEVKVVAAATAAMEQNPDNKENVTKEISARVNMRTMPANDSSKIMSLAVGADVELLGKAGDGYSLVQYNGIKGYVLDDYIVDSVEITTLGEDAILFECTAYCSCAKCCGIYSPEIRGGEAHTATGTVPKEGRTIAVDPSVIHYGTSVVIEGMGTYVAEDCGGGVKGNHIDIYFESHEAAIKFGRRRLYVSVQR